MLEYQYLSICSFLNFKQALLFRVLLSELDQNTGGYKRMLQSHTTYLPTAWADQRGGGQGVGTPAPLPRKNSQKYSFFSNTGLDPLENHKEPALHD